MAHILPFISTTFILISAVLVALGWRHIIKKRRDAHQETMLWGAGFALAFFLIYVAKTVLVGDTLFGGPDNVKPYYYTFLIFHIVLAMVAAVFGITTLTLAFRGKFSTHRKWGRITASVWFVTAVTGVLVYILLYVLYPGGETTGLINAIRGN